MTSNKPYLIRAMYEWIADNDMTPFVVVDALKPEVVVPTKHIDHGKIVLNISMLATHDLRIGNDVLECNAKFGGRDFAIFVPIDAIMAIYAQESNQGLTFAIDDFVNPEYPIMSDQPVVIDVDTDTEPDNIIPFKPKK